jgi:methylglutamate dehydrogenase subunit C
MTRRLPAGGAIDRATKLRFAFDGRGYEGVAGDTLASALLANGVKLVGRSFKYHRPRGIFTAGPEEPNALVELRKGARREPNTKATTIELFEGLDAASQNRWPRLAWDIRAAHQYLAPLLSAGFYYKSFMWPAAFWEKLYEPLIRRAAGLGHASGEADPDTYEHAVAHADLLVIGAGPAGLAAALAAARAGARVILCDDDFRLGGRLLSEQHVVDGQAGRDWAEASANELAAMPEVRIFRRTQIFGAYDGGEFGALERVADHLPVPPAHTPRQRFWRFVVKRAILATGAIERPIAFANNDRPGIMLASAARGYVNRFAVRVANKAVVFAASDDGWVSAFDLTASGADVTLVDPRTSIDPALIATAAKRGIRHLQGAVVDSEGGRYGVRAAIVETAQGRERIAADLIAVSGGFNPAIGIATHLGDKPVWSAAQAAFLAADKNRVCAVVGAAAGKLALGAALRDGYDAGTQAAAALGFAPGKRAAPRADNEASGVAAFWHVGASKKAFVDFQHDVTVADIELAHREGYRSPEHAKRYTTLGMATDQGKTASVIGHAILARLSGQGDGPVGTPAARAPNSPVAIGALAGPHRGKHFRPYRHVAGHRWALAQKAAMVETGQWLRPQYFPRHGEKDWLETVTRETLAVRARGGVCDVSTLGKIDVQGPDAAAFLDFVYANTFSTLAVGRTRYGVMLREDGFVFDDGTVARMAPDHFIVSTTTANAARAMQHLEFCHQVLRPELRVTLASVTEAWSQYAVAGPNSRALLQMLLGDAIDLSDAAFPYLACAEIKLRDIAVRLFRVSFSGELADEIAVPAQYGASLLDALMKAGAEFGIVPYGTETLGVLRVEKGHVAGNEINGQTTAGDLGLGKMLSTKKDFVGRVMAGRPALVAPDRPALVGLKPVSAGQRFRAGAHFLAMGAPATTANDEGYVTSVVYSPHVGAWIGLGLLKAGLRRIGQHVRAYDPVRGGDVTVEIMSPVFVDPAGERLRG